MPHDFDLVLTLVGGLTAAWVLGLVTQRLRLSPIVGYLLAGIVVGPFTPGFVAHRAIAEQLAEIGVILLMFGVGLHFQLRDLVAVRRLALPGALAQSAVATGLGCVVALGFGWDLGAGLVLGLAVSVASTVVLLRVLADADELQTPPGHVAVGWLVVEDLFTVLVLVLLPVLAMPEAEGGVVGVALAVAIAVAKIAALFALTVLVGQRVIPLLLAWVARSQSRELFTLTVLVLALGLAVGSAALFGASMALGAFLAGMIVGQSEFSSRAANEALPMRDAFAVLFFVSMGMLFDPASLVPHAGLIAAMLGIVLVGKPLVALGVVLALRGSARTAAVVAVGLAQIGEFTFILAELGRDVDLLPEAATHALVAASIVSVALNPLWFRLVGPMERLLSPLAGPLTGAPPRPEGGHRAIVVGYGPVGRSVSWILQEQGLEPTVVDRNPEMVARARTANLRAVHGDASDPAVLREAGLEEAAHLLFTSSGTPPSAAIAAATAINPRVKIVARAAYIAEGPELLNAGADLVIASEAEVALSLAEHLLLRLGATHEQIDRTRTRVRADLAAEPIASSRRVETAQPAEP